LSEENSEVTRKIDEQASAVKVLNGNNPPYGMYIMDGEKFLKAEVKSYVIQGITPICNMSVILLP
jgi:hypothetical protein